MNNIITKVLIWDRLLYNVDRGFIYGFLALFGRYRRSKIGWTTKGYLQVDRSLRALKDLPKISNLLIHIGPLSIPQFMKSLRAAINWSSRWFVTSIWPSAWFLFDRRQGSLTALICLDSVIDEQTPFGAPKRWIDDGKWISACCRGSRKSSHTPAVMKISWYWWKRDRASSSCDRSSSVRADCRAI